MVVVCGQPAGQPASQPPMPTSQPMSWAGGCGFSVGSLVWPGPPVQPFPLKEKSREHHRRPREDQAAPEHQENTKRAHRAQEGTRQPPLWLSWCYLVLSGAVWVSLGVLRCFLVLPGSLLVLSGAPFVMPFFEREAQRAAERPIHHQRGPAGGVAWVSLGARGAPFSMLFFEKEAPREATRPRQHQRGPAGGSACKTNPRPWSETSARLSTEALWGSLGPS